MYIYITQIGRAEMVLLNGEFFLLAADTGFILLSHFLGQIYLANIVHPFCARHPLLGGHMDAASDQVVEGVVLIALQQRGPQRLQEMVQSRVALSLEGEFLVPEFPRH